MKLFRSVVLLFCGVLLANPAFGQRKSSSHSSRPSASRSSASRPYYGGGKHTESHGGHYQGETNSHHKGGHYKNPKTKDEYGKHKP